jgi:hypothetical protein
MDEDVNWNDYYTPDQAAAKLTANSGKPISKDYLRSLVRDGVLHPRKIGNVNMYPRLEVDPYRVRARGETLKETTHRGRYKKGEQPNRAAS